MNWPPSPTFLKYLLLQIPDWLLLLTVLFLLSQWTELPVSAAGVLLSLWVIKDLALYPLLRRSYEGDPRTGAERLIGFRGVVITELGPHGYVRVRGELWRAEARNAALPMPEGSAVKVCAGRGLTLTVERDETPSSMGRGR